MISVDISKAGEVAVEVSGVKGRSCVDLTRDLERALGKVVADQKTPEFHQQGQATAGRATQ